MDQSFMFVDDTHIKLRYISRMPYRPKPLPNLQTLRELFTYDPETGALINKISRTSRKAGTRADTFVSSGYRQVYVDGRLCYAHRIIWALVHGKDADGYIDHIDRDHLNNRISNLRIGTHSMNMWNCTVRQDSTTGIKGVYHRKDNGKWRVKVIATFETSNEAEVAAKTIRKYLHGLYAKD
jgi:hypothetical protein